MTGSNVVGPPIFAALWLFWLHRAEVDEAADAGAHDIERAWWERACSTAFLITLPALLLAEALGDALRIPWVAPVGLTHVLVVGLGSLAGSYLVIRRRES